jgi:hypothetical protein
MQPPSRPSKINMFHLISLNSSNNLLKRNRVADYGMYHSLIPYEEILILPPSSLFLKSKLNLLYN